MLDSLKKSTGKLRSHFFPVKAFSHGVLESSFHEHDGKTATQVMTCPRFLLLKQCLRVHTPRREIVFLKPKHNIAFLFIVLTF